MGSSTSKIGDFQADVGRGAASLNRVFSIFFAILLFLFAIGFIVLAFMPLSEGGTWCTDDTQCDSSKQEKCNNGVCKSPKKRHYWFILIGVIMILLGIFIVWFANLNKKLVDNNRHYAQFQAIPAEIGMARQVGRLFR